MKCPKCGSEHVSVSAVNEVKEVRKHHSIWWWLFCGWLISLFNWIVFTPFKLIQAFVGKKHKIVSKTRTYAICQDCGYRWEV